MKINTEKHKYFLPKKGIMALALCVSLAVLGACSSDDEDGAPVGGGTTTAFNFNAGNAEIAAEIAAAAMSFFPEFTNVSMAVLETLSLPIPPNVPFDLGVLCNGGQASLSWVDNDVDGDFTDGDTASLQFTNCDQGGGETVSGIVDITDTIVNLPTSVDYTASVSLTISSAAETTTISAKFQSTVTSPDLGVSFTTVYSASDTPGQTLTVSENGTEYFKMGCFSVTQSFLLADLPAGTFDLAPSGAIKAASQVLSMASGPGLSVDNSVVDSGTQRLLSDSVPNCASIGFPNGAGDSDGSYLDMEMLGGGDIRLRTFDASDTETSSVNTTWDLLTN